MSEVQRKKKDNDSPNKKEQRREDQTADPRQNLDREGVHNEKSPRDEFDQTLERNSKKTKPNDGKGPQRQ